MKDILLVVGNGKLATFFLHSHDIKTLSFDQKEHVDVNSTVLLHCGSGRQLDEALDFCKSYQMPMIQASTSVNIQDIEVDFPLVDAPNLSIPILRFLQELKHLSKSFASSNKTIKESHQSTKTSPPKTAIMMADILQVHEDQIISVREPIVQEEEFNIPKEYLNSHAIHEIEFFEEDVSITFKTQVFGKRTYILGAKKLLGTIDNLPARYIHISELIENGLI